MTCCRAATAPCAALLVAVALLGSADAHASWAQDRGLLPEQSAQLVAEAAQGGVQTTCPHARHPACPEGVPAPFRTIDGSCAKHNRVLGMSGTPYKRKLRPAYADGKHEPRTGKDGAALPSAREVSNRVSPDKDVPNAFVNQFFMEWSQLFAHDITLIEAAFPEANDKCCAATAKAPDGATDSCARIDVPKDDANFAKKGVTCLGMQRSGAEACGSGVKEQRNMVTHFVDASFIYGSDNVKARKLRKGKGGLLNFRTVNGEMHLPVDEKGQLFAGDIRVTITALMSSTQTVMLREHNNIATKLAALNPHWDDERLYREARRIVVAEYQLMTYREWLPWLVGFDTMDHLELWPTTDGYSEAYEEYTDPRTANDFAAAAYRVFHSLIPDNIWLDRDGKKQGTIIDVNADEVLKPGMLRGIVEGMLYQPSQQQDVFEASQIRNRMFANTNGIGGDLIATDIMRGREHGLAGYNEYRRHCGLPRAYEWADFGDLISAENIEVLKSLYAHPDDVDFYVGGLLERRNDTSEEASIVPPVFRCVIANQLVRYKEGDPYFFDLDGPAPPFTLDQLDEIRQRMSSKLLCDNVRGLDVVPQRAFINLGVKGNANVKCDQLPGLDLSAWREDPSQLPVPLPDPEPLPAPTMQQPHIPGYELVSEIKRLLGNIF